MNSESLNDLLAFDRRHLWHPYTSLENPTPVYAVESGSGCILTMGDGRELVDGMSSWWSAVHGYNNPKLNTALTTQIKSMSHVMFGGLTHAPAVELGRTLLKLVPESLNRIFYCDSGSVAVEVAMKMAMQYMHARGMHGRKQFATIRGGYHGDTFHGMSVCDPVNGMHSLYNGILPKYIFADRPKCAYTDEWDENDFESMARQVEIHHKSLCAIVLEPIVQGAGGMYFYHPLYLKAVRELCDRYDILLIADEIATGFGRTGKLFACEHAGVVPDILCVGKALTGGYMTLGAVIATAQVARVISEGEPGVLMHGPTFMANPLACSVARVSLELLIENNWSEQVATISTALQTGLAPCRALECVAEVRVLGAIGVVELKKSLDRESMIQIQHAFVEAGVWIRPFGKNVYIMPPYVISMDDLGILTDAIYWVLSAGDF